MPKPYAVTVSALVVSLTVGIALASLHSRGAQRNQILALWLTQRGQDEIVVSWVSTLAGPSVVEIARSNEPVARRVSSEPGKLHHVPVRLEGPVGTAYRYRVRTGEATSPWYEFQWYAPDEVRLAVVANWHTRPPLDALLRDRPHLLLTAGDNVPNLYSRCGIGKACIKPYVELIQTYPSLFATTIFMPALGNHDKQIRPRGPRPPEVVVYDIEARAFLRCFPLPPPGAWWCLDLPGDMARILALDLHHTYDMGTTWQSCHSFDAGSEQFRWYRDRVSEATAAHLISIWNERNVRVRTMAGGVWKEPIARNTVCVSGFGHFAERACSDGVVFLNTSLRGTGDRYPDPQSRFLASEDNYVLLTLKRDASNVRLHGRIKSLAGETLDEFSVTRAIEAESRR